MCLSGLAFVAKPFARTMIVKHEFKDLEPCFDKVSEFKLNDLQFRLMVTANILITFVNDSGETLYDANNFRDYYKALGTVTFKGTDCANGKLFRLEGDMLTRDEMEVQWQDQFKKLTDLGIKTFEKHSKALNEIPTKVSIS